MISLALAMSALSGYAQRDVYVSTTGDDSNDGSAGHPFLTFERAFHEASFSDSADSAKDTLFINLEGGDYFLTRTLDCSNNLVSPVVLRGTSAVKPRILGGIRISGWENCGDGIFRAFVPETVLYGFVFEQFYVNGRRAVEARTPNRDWFFVKNVEELSFMSSSRPAYAFQQIRLYEQDAECLSELSAEELCDVKIRFYHKWDITRKKVSFFSADSNAVFIHGRGMKPWNRLDSNTRYVMSGYKGALDEAGEWYLDRKNGYIYYRPFDNENIKEAECIAPALTQWMNFCGTPERKLNGIRFENISFQYTAYNMPVNGEEPMQAAASIPAGIQFDFCDNVSFKNCEFMHTGGYAIWLREACRDNSVEHCYIADLGAGGIKIGSTNYPADTSLVSRHTVVDNCIITHAGLEMPCGVGIAIFHSSDNIITHNEISDLKYSGISVGWTWGYNNASRISPAVRNLIAYNHIHHIGWGELSDMGAVYTLGESHGTKICNNVIHDVLSYDYGGWGLYTDEGSTGIEITDNLVYRCKSGGFHQHYGRENIIHNNIFAFGYYYQLQYSKSEEHLSFVFRNNIILQNEGKTLDGKWDTGKIDMDYNLYWHTSGVPTFKKYSWKEWRQVKEQHSVVANPMFVDAENDNYDFLSLKNVKKINFKPFDVSRVGVYGADDWILKAKLSDETVADFQKTALNRTADRNLGI